MSVAFNKINAFAADIGNKVHNLGSDALLFYLTNTAPVATNTVYNTPADLSTANGYTAGGAAVTSVTYTQTSGTASLVGTGPTWTATGAIGPFRYAVLYNNTAGSKQLIGWYDYGSSVTMASGDTFQISEGANIFTLA